MKLISTQIALFSQNMIERPDLILGIVNEKLGGILDDMPNILNLPLNAPAEIPLVQAKSKDGVYLLNISRNRVDFIINPQYSNSDSPYVTLKNNKVLIEKYYKAISTNIAVIRVGVIHTLFEPVENNVKSVFDKYIKEPYSIGSVEVNFRNNKQTMLKGYTINNIRTIEAGELQTGQNSYSGVIFQFDTNNVPNDNSITVEFISSIYNHAANKIKDNVVKEMI